jgi:biopolymer transport protein ExbD
MILTGGGRFGGGEGSRSFNVTPIIDIVFLLIIFFLVVCQFIEAENFPVDVPEGCEFAQNDVDEAAHLTTVTVMKGDEGGSEFAVGSEKVSVAGYSELVERLAGLIDARLEDLPAERRIVTLRVDKDICFGEAQYALAGIAASRAAEIQLAALKEER